MPLIVLTDDADEDKPGHMLWRAFNTIYTWYKASLALWDHTVLPATRHDWTHPALTPASQAGTQFSYPSNAELT